MRKKPRIVRPEPPPGSASPPLMFAVPEFGEVHVRLLGEMSSMLQHYNGGKPIACPGEGRCPSAIHRGDTRWKGYVAAERWRDGKFQDWLPCVLEVTRSLSVLMRGRVLRGETWKLWRAPGLYGKLEVTGEHVDTSDDDGWESPDFWLSVVERVYGTKEILWGVEPPLDDVAPLLPKKSAPPTGRRQSRHKLEARPLPEQPARTAADLERLRLAKEQLAGRMNGTH